jgi:hypothetical protein
MAQKRTADAAVKHLEGKTLAPISETLPALFEKNAPSAVENGEFMTDALASWVKKGFVAGPFDTPPLAGFRSNPLMAAVQKNKVWPIMNLSSPKGRSFNDAINEWQVGGLQMSTPRLFADSVLKAGKDSVMSKQDIQDAYKLIPNPVPDWRLYGFSWLGKYFFDTSTVLAVKSLPRVLTPCPRLL